MRLDLYNVPEDDTETFDFLEQGLGAGVFQMENPTIGKTTLQSIKPKSIDHLAACVTIIRPGVLNAKFDDGESAYSHFIHRHNKEEDPLPPIPEVGNLLDNVYGIPIFQENALLLAKKLAGFDGPTAMKLQKGISKKKAEVINELRPKFIEGCVANGVKRENAEKLYDIIEKSNRYSFVRSHAVSYAHLTYLTAYCKTHYPVEFMVASLRMSDDKIDPKEEVQKIVRECAQMGIRVKPPTMQKPCVTFKEFDGTIFFGLSNIKGIGEGKAQELLECFTSPPQDWYTTLCSMCHLSKTLVENSIKAGVFSYLKVPRRKMLDDFCNIQLLSGGETKFLQANWKNYQNFSDLFKGVLGVAQTKRKPIVESVCKFIQSPAETLEDNLEDQIKCEKEMLGVALSYDMIDTIAKMGNCTIYDYNTGVFKREYRIVAQIMDVRLTSVKTGKNAGRNMAFVKLRDQTAECDAVIFSECYDEFGGHIKVGTVQTLIGSRGKSFIINGVELRGGF